MISKKLSFITYAYALGAIFVVVGHSTPTSASDMPLWIDVVRTFIYNFHMPLFFFIAGFLFKYTSELRIKVYGVFIKDKCIRFLTPYIILTLIGFVPKVLMSSYINEDVEFSFYYFLKVFFSPRDNVWGHFWFLPTLLIIYVFSYLILKASRHRIIYSCLLFLALVLAIFPVDINWFSLNDICDQLIYFCIGIFSEKLIINKRKDIFKIGFAIFNVFFAVLIFVICRYFNYFGYNWILNLSNVIIAILMIYSIIFLSILLENTGNKFLDYFSGKTFSIYIISWPCQAVVEIVTNRILHMHWYIVIPAMFFVGLGVPLLINEIYRKIKWHPKFINLLFGFSV